jgi:hypothetical protein
VYDDIEWRGLLRVSDERKARKVLGWIADALGQELRVAQLYRADDEFGYDAVFLTRLGVEEHRDAVYETLLAVERLAHTWDIQVAGFSVDGRPFQPLEPFCGFTTHRKVEGITHMSFTVSRRGSSALPDTDAEIIEIIQPTMPPADDL